MTNETISKAEQMKEHFGNAPLNRHISEDLLNAANIITQKLKETENLTEDEKQVILDKLIGRGQRPRGWTLGTIAPYYTAKNALELKIVLDAMFVDKTSDRKFLFKDFKLSRSSLYAKITQSWKYLNERLDRTGRYQFMKDSTKIKRDADGIAIRWKHNIGFTEDVDIAALPAVSIERIAKEVMDEEDTTEQLRGSAQKKASFDWRRALDEYLDTAEDNAVFFAKNLNLSEAQQDGIRASMIELDEFHIIKLHKDQIKIFKGTIPTL